MYSMCTGLVYVCCFQLPWQHVYLVHLSCTTRCAYLINYHDNWRHSTVVTGFNFLSWLQIALYTYAIYRVISAFGMQNPIYTYSMSVQINVQHALYNSCDVLCNTLRGKWTCCYCSPIVHILLGWIPFSLLLYVLVYHVKCTKLFWHYVVVFWTLAHGTVHVVW